MSTFDAFVRVIKDSRIQVVEQKSGDRRQEETP
jgi:hypothetical protein